ncbi:hypothetical protein KFU94_20810 [Chloroflexi bacterium TSY]|nr:hypothetical protein [Chloroflexi bacterium TSY]
MVILCVRSLAAIRESDSRLQLRTRLVAFSSGRLICYQAWHNLVPRTTKVDTANRTYSIYVIQDPAYNTPLVLATVMTLQPETIYLVYLERWPVEHPPLASKQMIGLHRQFVHADEACFRLPELGLLLAIFFPI